MRMPLSVVIQGLVSEGHNYKDILDFYTPTEIGLFARAIAAQKQESLFDSATAARLGQSTKESWRDFSKSIKDSVRKLTGMVDKATKNAPQRRDDTALSELFGQVLRTGKDNKPLAKTRGEIYGQRT